MARNPHLDERIVGRESFNDPRERFIARSNQPYFPSQDYRDRTGGGEFSGWRGQEDAPPYYKEGYFPSQDYRDRTGAGEFSGWRGSDKLYTGRNPFVQPWVDEFATPVIPKIFSAPIEDVIKEDLSPLNPYEDWRSYGDFLSMGERESLYDESFDELMPPIRRPGLPPQELDFVDEGQADEADTEEDSSRRKFLEYLLRGLLPGATLGKGLGQFMGGF